PLHDALPSSSSTAFAAITALQVGFPHHHHACFFVKHYFRACPPLINLRHYVLNLQKRDFHDRYSDLLPGASQTARSRATRISSGSRRSAEHTVALSAGEPEVSQGWHHRTPDRTRAGDHVPRAVDGRRRPGPCEPGFPRADEQRHRSLQGRPALPPLGQPGRTQVSG